MNKISLRQQYEQAKIEETEKRSLIKIVDALTSRYIQANQKGN